MKTKNTILLVILLTFTFSLSTAFAQNDVIYFMKDGLIVNQQSIKEADVDTIIFYNPDSFFEDARDGNIYQTVTIGSQVWMAENLKYLPSVADPLTGSVTVSTSYVYGYSGTDVEAAKATANYITYGVLYNWKAATTACPSGWHLPNDAEWSELTDNLGDIPSRGGKLKEKGTTHWDTPNTGATNESGFTALPGGMRLINKPVIPGQTMLLKTQGTWWSATQENTSTAHGTNLRNNESKIINDNYSKEFGFSVRCIKD